MRIRRLTALAVVLLLALAPLPGCAPAPTTPPGMFSFYLGEPQKPLVPGNTTESEGGKVISAVWTPLVTFDTESRKVTYDGAAESVTSKDNINWTIRLKPGWTFHDGTPVTAQSYVKAWNYTALSTNAQGASYFFSNVAGYDALQGDDQGGKPTSETLAGLRARDPRTIEVTLEKPFAIYPLTLGYSAFNPLPEAFYTDPEAFGKKPVGNGPFKADTEWVRGRGITLSRYDGYVGVDKAQSRGVVLRVYTELSTGYTDVLAGNLDVLQGLPPDAYASAPDIFGERYLHRPSPTITSLGFPLYDKRFADVRVRRALSMAIDRQAITNAIFLGTRVPADSFSPPTVVGYREDACGRWCEYRPDEAKQLLAEAGFDTSVPVDLWFNAGAAHDGWMTAVGNMFRKIGLSYRLRGNLQFNEFLSKRDAKEMTGPFRLAWVMDYPSVENFLAPQYATAAMAPAGSNTVFYSNKAFDDALAAGDRAPSIEAASSAYGQAEQVLVDDLPATPLFCGVDQTVWTKRVSGIRYDILGSVVLEDVVVKDDDS
ncbi:MAG: ABC transporter substrate-binding protein [Mycobacterium sp.]|nr:ABC transporter substrate-binding protein [Mycobacterium sp.]